MHQCPLPQVAALHSQSPPCCASTVASTGSTSDPAVEEALYDTPMCREFAELDVGVHKREEVIEAHPQVNWHVAMMPSHRKALNNKTPMGAIMEALEKTKAQTCARVVQTFLGSSQFRSIAVQDIANASRPGSRLGDKA